ncbi:MAG: pyrroloquinoline quinone precursor peptide PqqA [Gemmatimonadaceae bacterium]
MELRSQRTASEKRHGRCLSHRSREPLREHTPTVTGSCSMTWTKPEFEVVEVTMEITAYVARR